MADARSILVHHYESSPFSEKVRLALRLKNLAWSSVEIPSIMPKPNLVALTGGYRRTPVMQIGADIYCDTQIILRELDRRYELPTLGLPGHEGLASMVGTWADRVWFQISVGVIFGAIGDAVPEAFKKDREALSGRPFDTDAMKTAAPLLRGQWRAHLMWIEDRLAGGRGAGSGAYLVGAKPGLIDVHAHMNLWFMARTVPDFLNECFETAPLTKAWYERLEEVEGQAPDEVDGETAIEIAEPAAPRLISATVGQDPQGLAPGAAVAVAPDDYGKDWVEGALVHADAQRVIIRRTETAAGTVNVHFPRAGYLVRPV